MADDKSGYGQASPQPQPRGGEQEEKHTEYHGHTAQLTNSQPVTQAADDGQCEQGCPAAAAAAAAAVAVAAPAPTPAPPAHQVPTSPIANHNTASDAAVPVHEQPSATDIDQYMQAASSSDEEPSDDDGNVTTFGYRFGYGNGCGSSTKPEMGSLRSTPQ